jgi:hypothetical protein
MNLFHRMQRTHQPSASASRACREQRRRRPALEFLEGRQLLSLGPPDIVNTKTADYEGGSANATNLSNNGLSVVAWVDTNYPNNQAIEAQMLNADGTKRGPQITVEFNNLTHFEPAVAMDAKGDFVVAYVEKQLDGHDDVVAKRFNSLGQQIGGRVANVVIGDNKSAFDPSVVMDPRGDFVISYTVDFSSTDTDVRARLFNSSGNFVQSLSFNGATGANEAQSRVAMDPSGDLAIVWSKNQTEIDLARFFFDATNTQEILVGTGPAIIDGPGQPGRISAPSVAVSESGTMEIAYEFGSQNSIGGFGASSIGAQRFNFYTGTPTGSPIVIEANTGVIEFQTSLAELSSGSTDGPFVVGYAIHGGYNGNGQFNTGAEVTVVDSLDNGNQFAEQDHIFFADNQDSVAVSSDGVTGKFLVTYTGMNPSNNSFTNIFEQVGQPNTGPAAQNLALTGPIKPGHSATLSGQLVDAAGDTNLTLTVDWGDGSKPQQSQPGLQPFTAKHKYRHAGTYTVRATWTDSNGLSNSRDLTIVVSRHPVKSGPGTARRHHA